MFFVEAHEALLRGRSGADDESTRVIMRAMARKITWYEAAEIIGISCRQMRRWKETVGRTWLRRLV